MAFLGPVKAVGMVLTETGYFLPFLAAEARFWEYAAATACFWGWPALIISRTLEEKVFWEVPFLSGMVCCGC
jgi:hypothetical protein